MTSKIVLITGCSTGIGQDLARRLARANHTVIATARDPERLAELPVALRLPLDVTDSASIARATQEAVDRFGQIDVLVNNAGYGVRGAVEDVPLEDVHKIFDVNVYGVIRMVRAVAPHMRRQKAGRIINIGSIAGKFVLPVNGAYSATKFALEALSDALRLELAPFGIQVVLIQPGNVKTSFLSTAEDHARGIFANGGSPYRALYQRYVEVSTRMRRGEPGPEVVSEMIQRVMEAAKPRARYLAAVPFLTRLAFLMGDSVRDYIIGRMFGLPAR